MPQHVSRKKTAAQSYTLPLFQKSEANITGYRVGLGTRLPTKVRDTLFHGTQPRGVYQNIWK